MGHDLDDGATTTEPTCTQDGVKTFTCKRNNIHTRTEAIPATRHTWQPTTTPATCTTTGEEADVCSICGETRGTQTIGAQPCNEQTCPICNSVSIRDRQQENRNYGIFVSENPVTGSFAEISVRTPEQASATVRILDNLGNVVWMASDVQTNNHLPLQWDLRNSAGREIASGTYLIVVEATSISGRRFTYSTKVGVSR